MYINYNDYELLYLIKDGSEEAYKYLFHKYKIYVLAAIKDNIQYTDKINDIIQECLMTLDDCIWHFDDSLNVSFYSYFSISLRRKINTLLTNQYFEPNVFLVEERTPNIYNNIIGYVKKNITDELESQYFYDCIIGTMSTSLFVKKHNLKYYHGLKLRKTILDKIKKHIE